MSLFRNIKYFIQRGRRGYSDEDLWGFNDYLCKIIPPALRHLKNGTGCPGDLWDGKAKNDECHKWDEILEEMAQGFEATEEIGNPKMMWVEKDKWEQEVDVLKYKQLNKKYNRGMDLFKKYFMNLWD